MGIPKECEERTACVFNRGIFGYCLCEEHYNVRHGKKESRDLYYSKYPERLGLIVHIEDEKK